MSNTESVNTSTILSLSFTDRVISRSLKSCVNKMHTANSSTWPYFIRYASYTIEFLESRLDATEKFWFPILSKYDQELGERGKAHKSLRQISQRANETLFQAKGQKSAGREENVSEVLSALLNELEPILATESTLLAKVGPRMSIDDTQRLEEEDKKRRLSMMKKDGHLWCATFLMRSLTVEERKQFPPGVPNMAKSAMLMAGNWQFSREFQFAPTI